MIDYGQYSSHFCVILCLLLTFPSFKCQDRINSSNFQVFGRAQVCCPSGRGLCMHVLIVHAGRELHAQNLARFCAG